MAKTTKKWIIIDPLKLRPTEYAFEKLFKKSKLTEAEFGMCFLNWFYMKGVTSEPPATTKQIAAAMARAATAGK